MLGAYAVPSGNLVGDQVKNTTCQGRDVGIRNINKEHKDVKIIKQKKHEKYWEGVPMNTEIACV